MKKKKSESIKTYHSIKWAHPKQEKLTLIENRAQLMFTLIENMALT